MRPHIFLILFLLATVSVVAQDEEPPAPQFLYRDENRLVLVNGYTGETSELPFEVAEGDRFEWSPDGQYLLALLQDEDTYRYCLNLYDVDELVWLYDQPVSCDVSEIEPSNDGKLIVYSTFDGINGALWSYTLEDETGQEIYKTAEGNEINSESISGIKWSPTETYLTFTHAHQIMGGTLNSFIVMSMKDHEYFKVKNVNPYYASYNPVWSQDDSWFLIILKDEYVTTAAAPATNHQGDVYLINSETGDEYRLTYTPTIYEYDLHWTDNGNVAFTFTETIVHDLEFSTDEAKNIEEVPRDEIVMPEPVDTYNSFDLLANVMVSPDPGIGAWVMSTGSGKDDQTLEIGYVCRDCMLPRTAHSSFVIKNSFYYWNILIGWRPNASAYPIG